MKLKVTKSELPSPVEGARAAIISNTLTGDSVGIAMGTTVLAVKISDLVEFIEAQDKEDQTCPA